MGATGSRSTPAGVAHDVGADTASPGDWSWVTSALAADALDALGHRDQCLGADIRPLSLAHRLTGPAFPVRSVAARETTPARPYEGLLAALDDLPPAAVFVFATGRSDAAGVWGELTTAACLAREASGVLTDGLIRDVTRVQDSGFPVFSRGAVPYDSKGRIDVVSHGVPVVVDGVRIAAGDVIVADGDGVCVVPGPLAQRVLKRAAEKRAGERDFTAAVKAGMRVSDAFRAYGVL